MIEEAKKGSARLIKNRAEPVRFDGFIYGLSYQHRTDSGNLITIEHFCRAAEERDLAALKINGGQNDPI